MMVTGLLLAACSTTGPLGVPASGPTNYPPANFTHRVSTADVDVFWNCTQPESGLVEVDGVVQNTGGRDVKFMELNLVGVDPRNYSVSQATASLPDTVLSTNQISPFRMSFRTVGSEARFDLYYQYYPGPRRDAHRNFARDACSPTLHLAH